VATLTVTGRADLTGRAVGGAGAAAAGREPGRPPEHAKRTLIDGIRWRVRAGCALAGRAAGLRPRQTVCMACSAAGSATAPGR
jgi:hypothetical protein